MILAFALSTTGMLAGVEPRGETKGGVVLLGFRIPGTSRSHASSSLRAEWRKTEWVSRVGGLWKLA